MQDYHEEYAKYYESLTGHKDYKKEVELLINFIKSNGFNSDSRILSIGCGIGKHENMLATYFSEIVGIDNSPHMIKNARNLYQRNNLEFICCDIKDLNNEKFDIVISLFNVLNCIKNINKLSEMMKNISRLTNKKNIFIFEIWNKEAVKKKPPEIIIRNYKNKDLLMKRIATPIFDKKKSLININYEISGTKKEEVFELNSTHKIYLYSKEKIEEYLSKNNFKNIEWYSALSENLNLLRPQDRMLFCKSNFI